MVVVGEPLNDEAWRWYHKVIGEERCTVVDTWWQTGKNHNLQMYMTNYLLLHIYYITIIETGGIMIAPRPSSSDSTPKPGYPMSPFFGIDPVLLDNNVSYYQFIILNVNSELMILL